MNERAAIYPSVCVCEWKFIFITRYVTPQRKRESDIKWTNEVCSILVMSWTAWSCKFGRVWTEQLKILQNIQKGFYFWDRQRKKNFLADPWFIHEENARSENKRKTRKREEERRNGKAWKAIHPLFSFICECDGEEWAEFSLWHLRRKTRRKSRQGPSVIARRHCRCAFTFPHISLPTPIYRFFFLPLRSPWQSKFENFPSNFLRRNYLNMIHPFPSRYTTTGEVWQRCSQQLILRRT